MIPFIGTLSKGWLARHFNIAFDYDYYFDPGKRHATDRRCSDIAAREFADLDLIYSESNLGQREFLSDDQVLVGGIQPNMILGMLLGAGFIPHVDRDADISPTPLRDKELTALPTPQSLLRHDLIRLFDEQIKKLSLFCKTTQLKHLWDKMKKALLFFALIFAPLPGVLAASPFRTPPSDRQKINLDADWLFFRGDINGEEETHQVNRRPWQKVNLPHEWSIAGPYSPQHNTTQGFLPMEIGWYKKGLRFPDSYADKKIFIIFDGVYRESDVWMNYAHLGHHQSGYTGFFYDITDYVRTGNRIPNGLRVRVDARRHEEDMYEGCGIYRHVWLLVVNKVHIPIWGVFASAPRVAEKEATVKVQTRVQNESARKKRIELQTVIVDADGIARAGASSHRLLAPGAEFEFVQDIRLPEPHLWDIDDPYLYKACSIVKSDGAVVDVVQTTFGVRTFYFDAEKGFFLNGRRLKLKGFNAHYDFPGLGTALPDRIHWNAMTVMKKAGFNLFRSSHNPATPERLAVCDSIGLLVWDEIERKLESAEVELPLVRDVITRDRNHPSVILWSLENESPLESTAYGADIIRKAAALAHQLDPTRPTTSAASMPVNRNGYGEALDVVSYNYHIERADRDHLDFPHWKVALISEYAAAKSRRGVYGIEAAPKTGRKNPFDLYDGILKPIYEACTVVENGWRRIKARDYLGGGCLWAGIDYWGEGEAWPLVASGYGVVDMCLSPKDMYFYFVSQWTQTPMVHIFPHWTWPGLEGREIDVWAYSNCDSVRLFLNDRPLGTRTGPPEPAPWRADAAEEIAPEHLAWRVAYEPGALKAVGYRGGRIAATQEIHTAGSAAKIALTRVMQDYVPAEAIPPLRADGCDVVVLKAAVLDAHDHPAPQADNLISFFVEGDERIIGVGNGDVASHEANKATQRHAFNGSCVVIVQSTTQADTFRVLAASPGLQSGEITLFSGALIK